MASIMEGMDVVSVSIRPDDYVREHMRQTAPPAEMPTFAKHMAAKNDHQVGLLFAIMCLAGKTAYLECNDAPDLGKEAWRQANALPSFPVQGLTETPGSANLDAFATVKSSTDLVTPLLYRRTQVHVTHWSEGVDVVSAAHRSRAATVGSATVSLRNLFANTASRGRLSSATVSARRPPFTYF